MVKRIKHPEDLFEDQEEVVVIQDNVFISRWSKKKAEDLGTSVSVAKGTLAVVSKNQDAGSDTVRCQFDILGLNQWTVKAYEIDVRMQFHPNFNYTCYNLILKTSCCVQLRTEPGVKDADELQSETEPPMEEQVSITGDKKRAKHDIVTKVSVIYTNLMNILNMEDYAISTA